MAKKKVSKMTKALKKAKVQPTEPVWKGPSDPEGGITQSLLSVFLCCRERFRLKVIEGLGPPDQFSHRMEYGQMWHLCEEEAAKYPKTWDFGRLKDYCIDLREKYPLSQQQIVH